MDLSCMDCVLLLTGAQEESQVNRQVVSGRDVWKQLLGVPAGRQCCVEGLVPGSGNSAMETGLQEEDLDATRRTWLLHSNPGLLCCAASICSSRSALHPSSICSGLLEADLHGQDQKTPFLFFAVAFCQWEPSAGGQRMKLGVFIPPPPSL